ncbi:MAG: HlyD family efflux transporter periplasmic adaptor subunit, partial [Alphaproteobacteria bacterium]|nr:HlyD family efflux transporter periplasmic adaptor subunit [Alphaproteobacteria bacterium]
SSNRVSFWKTSTPLTQTRLSNTSHGTKQTIVIRFLVRCLLNVVLRQSNLALSRHIPEVLNILKAAQFDLINSVSDKRAIARDDFNRRKFAAELAAARHQQAQAELEKAETTRERQIIRAPIDGQVLEVNLRPGEYASAGSLPSPLMRLGDTSRLHVRVEIDEENAARVKPGSTARGLRRGDTQNPVALHFVRFEPYVRPKQNLAVSGQRVDTRVLQVIYALEDAPGQNVFVGQQMDVFIEDAQTAAKE